MNTSILNQYPKEIQQDIINILSCFDKCNVSFSNGKYHVHVGISLSDNYPDDFRVCGTYKNSDVYTKEEIVNNIKNL